MRYGVISDIHSNLVALERVLAYLTKMRVDRYLCLGDIVGYGARPNECCELMRKLDCVCIRGNHDTAACTPGKERWFNAHARICIMWTRQILTEENCEYLRTLPQTEVVQEIQLCHGSLTEPDAYIRTAGDALLSLKAMTGALCLFGHTHYAEWYTLTERATYPSHYRAIAGGTLTLEKNVKHMLNPGAVGQPRDGNSQAGCAIVDTEARTVEIARIGYDIDVAQEQIRSAGLPPSMAARLLAGI